MHSSTNKVINEFNEGWFRNNGISSFSSFVFLCVFSNEGVVGVSFLSIVIVFSVELSFKGGLISFSLSNKGIGFFELFVSSGKFGLSKEGLSLEFSKFSIQLDNSLFEVGLFISFVSGFLVEGVNEVDSEVVEGVNDLSKSILVSEVLVSGKLEEGLNKGSELVVALKLVVDGLDMGLDLLDLNEGWVGDGAKEFKTFINSGNSISVFSSSGFEVSMILSTLFSFLSKSFSVFINVLLKLFKSLSNSCSLWNQDIVNKIVTVEDISFSVFNRLGEGSNSLSVFTSSLLEGLVGVIKFNFKVVDDALHGFKELIQETTGLEMDFSEIKHPFTPSRLSSLSNSLLLMISENLVHVNSKN